MIIPKIGIWITLPENKLPGYYAQIVKALAGNANLFDRDKDLLVVSSEEEAAATEQVLAQYRVTCERLPLLLVPDKVLRYPEADDYGFVSRLEHTYYYADQVFAFRLVPHEAHAEAALALQQMEEHLVGLVRDGDEPLCLAPCQHDELMAGIAIAYGCRIELL